MAKNIIIEKIEFTPVEKQKVELVERKGIGHPDSIADGLSESVSRALCKMYIERYGRVLHHNTDETQIVGGQSAPKFGPFVVEFQTIAGWGARAADEFAQRLDEFLAMLPREVRYAVEVRNQEFLTPAYFAVLREHNVAHVFSSWTRMPAIGTQLDLADSITADFLVSRALLRPGRNYEDAVRAFSPYDRIRDPSPELRSDLVRLARTAERLRIPAYLLVNNHAEGSAPHTIAAVTQLLAEG